MAASDNESNPRKTFIMQSADLKMWQISRSTGIAPVCDCLNPQYGNKRFPQLKLHAEIQNTESEGWKALESLIDAAISQGAEQFAPGLEMPPELWRQIVTLPNSISKLTSVRKLYLYGGHLVRLPPEIGDMVNLEELDLYTSYRLHWVPYEVTRCRKLARSRVSTRALYGNYNIAPHFRSLVAMRLRRICRPNAACAASPSARSRFIRYGFPCALLPMFCRFWLTHVPMNASDACRHQLLDTLTGPILVAWAWPNRPPNSFRPGQEVRKS